MGGFSAGNNGFGLCEFVGLLSVCLVDLWCIPHVPGEPGRHTVHVESISAFPAWAPIQVALCQPDGAGGIQNEDAPWEHPERAGENLGKVVRGVRWETKRMRGIVTPPGYSCNSVKSHVRISGKEMETGWWAVLQELGWVGHSEACCLSVEAVGNSRCLLLVSHASVDSRDTIPSLLQPRSQQMGRKQGGIAPYTTQRTTFNNPQPVRLPLAAAVHTEVTWHPLCSDLTLIQIERDLRESGLHPIGYQDIEKKERKKGPLENRSQQFKADYGSRITFFVLL